MLWASEAWAFLDGELALYWREIGLYWRDWKGLLEEDNIQNEQLRSLYNQWNDRAGTFAIIILIQVNRS